MAGSIRQAALDRDGLGQGENLNRQQDDDANAGTLTVSREEWHLIRGLQGGNGMSMTLCRKWGCRVVRVVRSGPPRGETTENGKEGQRRRNDPRCTRGPLGCGWWWFDSASQLDAGQRAAAGRWEIEMPREMR